MAIDDTKLAKIATAFEGLPSDVQLILKEETAGDILNAFATIIRDKRTTSLRQLLTQAITGDVTVDWTLLDQSLASVEPEADRKALQLVKTAIANHNAQGLTIKALAYCISSIKTYGL